MRVMLLVVAVALAGCFDPRVPTGIACGGIPPEACPRGQVCVAGVCELPIDAAPRIDAPTIDAPADACTTCTPADSDGDGVLDVSDNCPMTPNADQDNEDGDATGDACDKCPAFADTGADADGDGVGDLCDPFPQTPGDKIVAFAGFAHGLPAGWTVTGSVVAMNGDAIATAPANGGALLMRPEPTTATVTIYTDATFEAYVPSGGATLAGLGIAARHEAGTDNSIACQLVGSTTLQKLRLYDASTSGLVDEIDHPMLPGTRSVLVLSRTGTQYRCTASAPTALTTGAPTFAPASPEIGLRMRSGTARYHWAMIVTSP